MITPTRLREIYAEELRKLGEERLAERVLSGADVEPTISAAFKAMLRVADESPKQALFGALMNRLDEVGKKPHVPEAALNLIDVTGRDGG